MKTLTVAQFKAQFRHLINSRVAVIVRRRKTFIGIWQPLEEKQLQAKRKDILLGFINLGNSNRRDIAQKHDEYLYGKSL